MVQPTLVIQAEAQTSELLKIATRRWKEMLDTVGGAGRRKLEQAGVLDYGREIPGLERGTQALAEKSGINIREAGLQDVKEGLVDLLTGHGSKKLKDTAVTAGLASVGGGYSAFPAMNTVFTTPGLSPITKGLKGQTREGVEALVRRHEVDELRAAKREAKRIGLTGASPRVFNVERSPEGLREKLTARALDVQRAVINKLEGALPSNNPNIMNAISGAKSAISKTKGKLVAGRHIHPDVILQESKNVAAFPPEVAQQMAKFRKGEVEMMGPHGLEYAKTPSRGVRKQLAQIFAKGNL